MKSAENCFLEIVSHVQNQRVTARDKGEKFLTNIVNYSKILEHKTRHLAIHQSSSVEYVHMGDLDLSNKFTLHFYFSNKRSYLSIDLNEKDVTNAELQLSAVQLYTLKYTELLYKFYTIDEFIFNLELNKSQTH